MAEIARLIGGAGTGKTTELLRIMTQVIEKGIRPEEIGFVSFTKAARAEASERASKAWGIEQDELERFGWFKTLHAVCYRCLGAGNEMLTDNKKSADWMKNALQADVGFSDASDDDNGLGCVVAVASTDAAKALAIWSAARNRMQSFETAWRLYSLHDDKTPPLAMCLHWVERYEMHKTIDNKRDFTDLLTEFAGIRFGVGGPHKVTPHGEVPSLPVWFFDEQQDTSRLLDAVCHRLINTPSCQWVYVVGDPFQSIFSFAGADSRCFREWDATKERTMPKSYRNPAPIHKLGERILKGCSDYFSRGIAPADHEGVVQPAHTLNEVIAQAKPTESWLFIARTNFQAKRFANLLNFAWCPWRPTRGNGGWQAPKRNLGLAALMQLETGWPIFPEEWLSILNLMPTKALGLELLVRGTKSKWEASGFNPPEDSVTISDLELWGATRELVSEIRSGGWIRFIEHANRFVAATKKWGSGCVDNSGVRVGTIHSVKGQEADNVVFLTTTSAQVSRSLNTQEGRDEERRIAYVAVTRARKKLILLEEQNERYRMEIEI